MEYRCEICYQKIPQDEYEDNDGLCDECCGDEHDLYDEFDERT